MRALGGLVKAGFGLAVLILCAVSAVSYWAVSSFIDAAAWVSQSHMTIESLGHLATETMDMESSSRAYVLSGDRHFADNYVEAARQARQTVAKLRKLAAGDRGQQKRVQALESAVEEKISFHARNIEVREREGIAGAAALLRTGEGRRLDREIRRIADAMEGEARTVLARRSADAHRQGMISEAAVFMGMAVSLTILLMVYLHLLREVSRRRRSEEKLIHLNRLHWVLTQTSQAVARSNDLMEMLQRVCRVAVEYGGFRMAWVGLVDEASATVRTAAHYGVEDGYLADVNISLRDDAQGRGPTGACLRQGRYFVCHDIAADPLMAPLRMPKTTQKAR